MIDKTKNILIVGVGGQGVILASELLSEAAMKAGFDVKKSEVHGMAQRGGVVSSHVRFARKVYSPLIPEGDSDVVLAFEAAEGLRWANNVNEDGLVVVNTQEIIPPIAFTKGYDYPEKPIEQARKQVKRLIAIDAIGIAQRLGNVKGVNTVLLGAIAGELPISDEIWEAVIRRRVPRGTEEMNIAAFKEGAKAAVML
ncbi:MAG: indolepyruvate oxidoreductase subunit beta [Candidatus Hatepunaea meridiana]|nr:indolepyruvate oxidoreductase subunit beta [Candidatus Hatepunaea meridiana]